MKNAQEKQLIQDEEYCFPYHYIAQFEQNKFQHFLLDSWAINYSSTIDFLIDNIYADKKTRIVDIGCGDGRLSRVLAKKLESTVTGIDYSHRAIALANAMNYDLDNVEFYAIDISEKNDFMPFDIAILMEVLEHIPPDNIEQFISSTHSLIKKGGTLFLTVPHENKDIEYKHFQHFTVEKIKLYLSTSFDIIEVIPFEKTSWTRNILLKFIANNYFIISNIYILSKIYNWYKCNLFFCKNEELCQRIFVKAIAK